MRLKNKSKETKEFFFHDYICIRFGFFQRGYAVIKVSLDLKCQGLHSQLLAFFHVFTATDNIFSG